jgi:hypothetical protein
MKDVLFDLGADWLCVSLGVEFANRRLARRWMACPSRIS